MRWLVLLLSAMFLVTPAAAQDASPKGDGKCAYAGKSFSEGGLVRIGDQIFECKDRNWIASEGQNANCFYQDRFYGPGSLVNVKDVMLECQIDGTWHPVIGFAPAPAPRPVPAPKPAIVIESDPPPVA